MTLTLDIPIELEQELSTEANLGYHCPSMCYGCCLFACR